MKQFFSIFLFIFFLQGCSFSSKEVVPGELDSALLYESALLDEMHAETKEKKDCNNIRPDNPYSRSREGHHAGFEWAQNKEPSSCGGNSRSFIEGCDEYLRQLYLYKKCL